MNSLFAQIDFEIAAFVGTLAATLALTYIANKFVNWILRLIFKRISPTACAFSSAIVVACLCILIIFTGGAEIEPGEKFRSFLAYLISVSVWLAKDLNRPALVKWLKWFWPELADVKESEKAAREGAAVCFLVAGGSAIIGAMSVWLGKPVFGMDAVVFIDAGIVAIAGWRIWRLSRIWAVLALTMFILTSVYALDSRPLLPVLLIRVILTLILISGVRGTFAYHRFRSRNLR